MSADPPSASDPGTTPTDPPAKSVAAAVGDARREAEAMRQEVEAISAAHLKTLLADATEPLVEHLDDPEFIPADRGRLLQTLRSRQKAVHPPRSRRTVWRRFRPSSRTIGWSLGLLAALALLLAMPLRSTSEKALVIQSFTSTLHEPNGQTRPITFKANTTIVVRRWFRTTPIAIGWVSDAHVYRHAPVLRSAIRFPAFPYLD